MSVTKVTQHEQRQRIPNEHTFKGSISTIPGSMQVYSSVVSVTGASRMPCAAQMFSASSFPASSGSSAATKRCCQSTASLWGI